MPRPVASPVVNLDKSAAGSYPISRSILGSAAMTSGAVGGGHSNGSPFMPCLYPQSIHSSTSLG